MSELLTLGRVRLAAGSAESAPPPAQPKRVALLAYLALMTGRGTLRRDLLLALFWPELGEEEGRRALRQALHYLRRTVGEAALVTAGDEISVDPAALRCDAVEFERRVDDGRLDEGMALYQGDFLEGFHVPDVSAEFEEWVDRTRMRLRRRASAVAWTMADTAEGAGQGERAIEWGRRASELEPDQEAGWRRLMRLQERQGDRAGALRTFEDLRRRLVQQFDVADPAAETVDLANAIRAATAPSIAAPLAATAPHALPNVSGEAARALPAAPPAAARRTRARAPFFAAAALVLAAAAFVVLPRLAARHATPALVTPGGALRLRDRILVADFTDRIGDSALAMAITEAFRIDFAQSPLVRVLTTREMRSTLARMERAPDLSVDDSLAREIAVREGVKAFVTGSLTRVGPAYTVNARIVNAESGQELAAVRETAEDSTDLIGAVGRASRNLRRRMGESASDLRTMPDLLKVTTRSLDALRTYTAAKRLFYAGDRTGALAGYARATTLDTGFAMAWLATAQTWSAIDERGRAAQAFAHAFAHQDRLPYLERGYLRASRAWRLEDYDAAIDAYRQILERYPENVPALNNLALVFQDTRQYARAESLFARAITIDSTIANLYFGVHAQLVLQGRFAESRQALDLIARRFPGNPLLQTVEVQDAAARQDWTGAEHRAEANVTARRGDTLQLVDAYEAMAGIAMTEGRLADAGQLWRTQLALSSASGSRGRNLFGVLQLAWAELRYRNAPGRAAALVDSALERVPLDSMLPGDRPELELARFFAVTGDVARARALLASAAVTDSLLDRQRRADRGWTLGVIALAERNPSKAEVELRHAADTHACPICPLPDLARAYEQIGDLQAASAVLQRYADTPWLFRYEPDALELGWSLRRLAELYDRRGLPRKARDARARLLELWRRADPDMAPAVADARAHLTE